MAGCFDCVKGRSVLEVGMRLLLLPVCFGLEEPKDSFIMKSQRGAPFDESLLLLLLFIAASLKLLFFGLIFFFFWIDQPSSICGFDSFRNQNFF